ncbi:hypothetical protein [Rouxiella sp. Mn2063]|uniref:hypothetical protein n=1 Tax=Rouxiella sp. Mn2063 TaxID=3395262 RepID=UPI003BB9C6F4
MPIFTITLRRTNTIDKKQISAAIHAASLTTGYPKSDYADSSLLPMGRKYHAYPLEWRYPHPLSLTSFSGW